MSLSYVQEANKLESTKLSLYFSNSKQLDSIYFSILFKYFFYFFHAFCHFNIFSLTTSSLEEGDMPNIYLGSCLFKPILDVECNFGISST